MSAILLGLFLLAPAAFSAPIALPGVPAPAEPSAAPQVSTGADAGRLAIQLLERAGRAPDFEVRALAASAWGAIGNPAARPVLEKALNDRSVYVRIEAATALQKL